MHIRQCCWQYVMGENMQAPLVVAIGIGHSYLIWKCSLLAGVGKNVTWPACMILVRARRPCAWLILTLCLANFVARKWRNCWHSNLALIQHLCMVSDVWPDIWSLCWAEWSDLVLVEESRSQLELEWFIPLQHWKCIIPILNRNLHQRPCRCDALLLD